MGVYPFEIFIPQATLDDLRNRLAHPRWPDEVAGAGWDYGANLAYLKELVDYWQHDFDWRQQETAINRFEHFRAEVDGVGIHFIHARGKGSNPLPLLLLHGWPSSFFQMLKLIPLLTDPASHGGDAADSFDVIVPSLPGYGFSDLPRERGMSVARIADLFAPLMTDELGYKRYAARGSDLGAGVIQVLAAEHPEALMGIHLSGTNPFIGQIPDHLTAAEQAFVANAQRWGQQEMAYAAMHSTKPQTVGFALNDSPVGLAAWIVEKFRRWSDCDGEVEQRFTKDELLTNLTIYWATETITSSMRLYYETVRDAGRWRRSDVPTGLLMAKKDMFPTPREWIERSSRVDRWTEIERGGHFLDMEEPEVVAQEVRAFFRTFR